MTGERGVLTSILCEPGHFEASQAPFSRTGCLPDSPGALQHHTCFWPSSRPGGPGTPGAEPARMYSRQAPVCSSEAAHAQLGSRRLHPKGSTAALSSTSLAPRTRCLNGQREARPGDPWLTWDRLLEVVAELLLQDYEEQTSVYSKQGTAE